MQTDKTPIKWLLQFLHSQMIALWLGLELGMVQGLSLIMCSQWTRPGAIARGSIRAVPLAMTVGKKIHQHPVGC